MLEDYQWIQDTNKAWRLAQKLASNDEMQTMHVYFLIRVLVIDVACQGKTELGPDVFFLTCKQGTTYLGGQELFMSNHVGDTILALDAPSSSLMMWAMMRQSWMLMVAFGQCMA